MRAQLLGNKVFLNLANDMHLFINTTSKHTQCLHMQECKAQYTYMYACLIHNNQKNIKCSFVPRFLQRPLHQPPPTLKARGHPNTEIPGRNPFWSLTINLPMNRLIYSATTWLKIVHSNSNERENQELKESVNFLEQPGKKCFQ